MRQFSRKSKTKLSTVEPELQIIMEKALQVLDITVLEGYRDEATQNRAFKNNQSKLKYPDSKHNTSPSRAIDITPWPIPSNWGAPSLRLIKSPDGFERKEYGFSLTELKERAKFYYMAGIVKGIAFAEGTPIRWGGDWDGDGDFSDPGQSFDDLVHFELKL